MGEVGTVVRTVEALKALVGQELGVGAWLPVSQELVNAFAEVTGDHQYIHTDPARARETRFGGTIAHGYLTLSLLPLLTRSRQGVQIDLGGRMTVNYGLNRVRFPGPVPVGSRIRVRTTLLAVAEIEPGAGPEGRPQAVQLTCGETVEVEGTARPGMVAETLMRIYF